MYKDILDNTVLSFSRLHEYEQCPYSFYLEKIEKSDDKDGNYYAEVGSLVHEILEKVFKKELDIDDAADYFMNHYDEYVTYEAKQSTIDTKYEQALDYFANFDWSDFDKYEILGVEKEVHFKIDGHDMVGYIDLLLRDKETEKIIVWDHKSAGHFLKKDGTPLKNKIDNFNAYRHQMNLYSKAIYEEYGEYPEKIIWNHFFEQTLTVIPFDEKEYVKSIAWAAKIIHKIYEDQEFQALETKDYMLCGMLCDFRNVCQYRMEED